MGPAYIEELRNSSENIGRLYPILVDRFDRVIDGEHRLKANENWRKVKLEHIKTEKQLLLARLVCNNLRRSTSGKEKTELLASLAEIFLSEGTPVGKIAYELSVHTGMSYRWVTKYLPDRFKDNIHAQAPKKRKSVANHASTYLALRDPPEDMLKLSSYRNTSFVNFVMNKKLFSLIKKKAQKLETNVTTYLYSVILSALNGTRLDNQKSSTENVHYP